MTQAQAYDVWVISDADGPVLYFPSGVESRTSPADHVSLHRQQASRPSRPDGLIEGVWERARQRLLAPAERLVAEVADPEVEIRRAAQRAATLARSAHAAAWAPEELLAPEPAPAAPRPARKRAASAPSPTSAKPRTQPRPAKPLTPTARRPDPEPEEAVCRNCFMVRRVDQLEDGVCADGCQ